MASLSTTSNYQILWNISVSSIVQIHQECGNRGGEGGLGPASDPPPPFLQKYLHEASMFIDKT